MPVLRSIAVRFILMQIIPSELINAMDVINVDRPESPQINTIQKLSDDLYIGELKSETGETIYFGMERLDERNSQIWKQYSIYAKYVGSKMFNIGLDIKDFDYKRNQDTALEKREIESEYRKNRHMTFLNDLKDLGDIIEKKLAREGECTNFPPEFFAQEALRLLRSKIDTAQVIFGPEGISNAMVGFSNLLRGFEDGNRYVAYASRVPIVGKFMPKLMNENEGKPSYKDLQNAYGDLIMSVGVYNVIGTPFTVNRGIFRYPIDVIVGNEGGYKGISLKLHGFAGKIAHQFFCGKMYMGVYPMSVMQKILEKMVSAEDMFVEYDKGVTPSKYRPIIFHKNQFGCLYQEMQDHFDLFSGVDLLDSGAGESLHLIKMDKLAEFYCF